MPTGIQAFHFQSFSVNFAYAEQQCYIAFDTISIFKVLMPTVHSVIKVSFLEHPKRLSKPFHVAIVLFPEVFIRNFIIVLVGVT